jgi:hypothetical protein
MFEHKALMLGFHARNCDPLIALADFSMMPSHVSFKPTLYVVHLSGMQRELFVARLLQSLYRPFRLVIP